MQFDPLHGAADEFRGEISMYRFDARPVHHLLAVLAIVLALVLAGTTALSEGEPGQPFESRTADWRQHFDAGDIQGLVEDLYTEDARLFAFDGTVVEGREALVEHFQSFLDAGLTSIDITSRESGSDGTWGYDVGTYTLSTEENAAAAAGEYLTLTRWDGDRWRIFLHYPRALPPAPAEGATTD